MLRNTAILSAMLLMMSGCASTINQLSVQRQLPSKPNNHLCGELMTLESVDKSHILGVVAYNHAQYVDCQHAASEWQEWYKLVSESFEVDASKHP
jgi:hypothetical protein